MLPPDPISSTHKKKAPNLCVLGRRLGPLLLWVALEQSSLQTKHSSLGIESSPWKENKTNPDFFGRHRSAPDRLRRFTGVIHVGQSLGQEGLQLVRALSHTVDNIKRELNQRETKGCACQKNTHTHTTKCHHDHDVPINNPARKRDSYTFAKKRVFQDVHFEVSLIGSPLHKDSLHPKRHDAHDLPARAIPKDPLEPICPNTPLHVRKALLGEHAGTWRAPDMFPNLTRLLRCLEVRANDVVLESLSTKYWVAHFPRECKGLADRVGFDGA
jgi:hypothetical protein